MSVSIAPEQRVLLEGIRWETYEQMLADLQDRPIRLTYDRGTLEIMSPSRRHEGLKVRLGRLIETMTLELGIPIECGGSTTWRRQDLAKGLEPDGCYWVQNESVVRDLDELDLRIPPPPDLAVEVEVWSSSVDRMGIYAALGVPDLDAAVRRLGPIGGPRRLTNPPKP